MTEDVDSGHFAENDPEQAINLQIRPIQPAALKAVVQQQLNSIDKLEEVGPQPIENFIGKMEACEKHAPTSTRTENPGTTENEWKRDGKHHNKKRFGILWSGKDCDKSVGDCFSIFL